MPTITVTHSEEFEMSDQENDAWAFIIDPRLNARLNMILEQQNGPTGEELEDMVCTNAMEEVGLR